MTLRHSTARILEQGFRIDGPGRGINLFLILLISLNVVAIFLESVPAVHALYQRSFWWFEVFSIAVFSVEYLVRVWSSVDLPNAFGKTPVMARLRYMLSPLALIDLVAILPFYFSLFVALDLRFLRVLRLLRLFKIARYSASLGALLDVMKQEADTLIASIVVLLMMLVIASGGIYFFENEAQPEAFGSMPSSMWWAIVTLTTVGYGDVVPVTVMGKMFGGLVGLIGIGMIALPAAILASGFAENIHERKQKYNRYVRSAMRDGTIDKGERSKLESLRQELGLTRDEAAFLLHEIFLRAKEVSHDNCPHCGRKLDS